MSAPYGNIYDSFNELMGNSGNFFFSDATIDRFAFRALNEACERSRYKDTAEVINSVADTGEYEASADGYDIFRVEYDDEILLPISRAKLRHGDRDWESRSGTPRYYYLDEIYSVQDYLAVGLWEKPGTSTASAIRLWYHGAPNVPVSTSALTKAVAIEIPEWAAPLVLYYMLHLAYSADTKKQDFGASALYHMMYEDVLDRLVIRSRDRQPKHWVSGTARGPSIGVLNRLPQRITE